MPPPPGGRSGAGAGRLAGPTSAQPGRGRPQNGGRARRGRGRACDRARASHLDAEARASLSPQRWLRRRRALLTRFSPPPTGRRRADRQRRAHWLRPLWRQRVPTAPRDLIGWRGASFPRLLLIGSRAHPSRENRSPSTLLQPPTPKPGFPPPSGGLTANGGTERGRWVGGWAVWGGGERSQWERAAHPGSAAPPPATRDPEGRARCHARLPLHGSPARAKGAEPAAGARARPAALAACLGPATVDPGAPQVGLATHIHSWV